MLQAKPEIKSKLLVAEELCFHTVTEVFAAFFPACPLPALRVFLSSEHAGDSLRWSGVCWWVSLGVMCVAGVEPEPGFWQCKAAPAPELCDQSGVCVFCTERRTLTWWAWLGHS